MARQLLAVSALAIMRTGRTTSQLRKGNRGLVLVQRDRCGQKRECGSDTAKYVNCSLANHASSFKERKRRLSLRLLRPHIWRDLLYLILRTVRSKIPSVHLHVFTGGLRRLYNDQHWSRRNQLKQSEARRARSMHSRKILLLFVTFLVSVAVTSA